MKLPLMTIFAFMATISAIFAQTTNVLSGAASSTGLPTDLVGFWTLAIAAVTPLVIHGVKKFVPAVPSLLLPCLTPVVGIVLGLAINWLASKNLGWIDMAQAGALAVFVRETVNQSVTKRFAKEVASDEVEPPES